MSPDEPRPPHQDSRESDGDAREEDAAPTEDAAAPEPAPEDDSAREEEPVTAEDAGALPLEPHASPLDDAASILDEDAPDACPACGEVFRPDSVVCLRCGFNLRTGKAAATRGAAAPADDHDDDVTDGPIRPLEVETGPLVVRSRVDGWLPLTLAAIAGLVLILGIAGGVAGFHAPADGVVPWTARIEEALRLLVRLPIWAVCGFAGLLGLGWLRARPIGSYGAGLSRMLAIAAIAHTAAYIEIRWPSVELAVEIIAQLAVAMLGLMLWYRLKPRDAGTALALGVGALFALALAARVVRWAI